MKTKKNNLLNFCPFRKVTDFDALQGIPDWLETINMSKYADQFTVAGYDKLEHVCKITDNDLDSLGVKLIGHRNKIRKSIKALKDHYRKKRESCTWERLTLF